MRIFLSLFLIPFIVPNLFGLSASESECARTANMQIYSVVSIDKETGDLDGYELAIEEHKDSTVDAWLYVYEGAPNDEAIHISGTISGGRLILGGTWAEHLIEYPSKKEIVQTHLVKMEGSLDPTWFRGTLKIDDLYTPDIVRLKRARRIWLCR